MPRGPCPTSGLLCVLMKFLFSPPFGAGTVSQEFVSQTNPRPICSMSLPAFQPRRRPQNEHLWVSGKLEPGRGPEIVQLTISQGPRPIAEILPSAVD